MLKKLIVLLLCVSLISSLSITSFAQEGNITDKVEIYKNHLLSKNTQDSKEALTKFNSLSKEKQKKFVEILFNPKLMKEAFTAKKSKKISKDLSVEIKTETTKTALTRDVVTMDAKAIHTIKGPFGINLFRGRVRVAYKSDLYKVYKIVDSNVSVLKNWTLHDVTTDRPEAWVKYNSAYVIGTFHFIAGVSGIGLTMTTKEAHLRAYADGDSKAWLKDV